MSASGTASSTAALEVSGIEKRFGAVEVLRGVSMQVAPGEVLGVVGDNGAGKSTLMKVISGVHRADAGRIRLAGHDVAFRTPRDARDAGIETIYQDLALADHLDVGANIFLGREPIRRFAGLIPMLDERKIHGEVAALLGRIESHIPDPSARVLDLSGGQRQAVAIARALYWKAKIVIMDEPTAALAVMETENVLKMARQLAAEGIGVLFIGHNLVEILKICDRVMVMYRGRKVFDVRCADTSQTELIRYMTGYADAETNKTEGEYQ
ncbi:MAG: ABC transporter ATP-binding protein [Acidiphilium sp. 37-64-53]|jgi:simple sugar transport system ATP-binding protein|uniref:ATP-binding cassette domain-containing protein n=1 Tax=Acidiphilium TaxID=522 RepID=UPI000BD3A47A|nr:MULTISPECIES: ATP-binding cassette domain-containing protein [Acidiphilium]OYW03538.1 MAG: ABC transporter ATP-binding protein [Acidiphilium sp. 37-64-53]OZB29518.1 MAG: ABC transporter ATP-binding protein [Acidiphilium sp. 34-64-41]HQT84188.1 ATP-binding cassette domain-containing protein [Acidiphilium rubrum]